MKRQERKLEHLKYSIEMSKKITETGFGDLSLIHQSASGLRISDTDTATCFLGKRLEAPLMINAITGGHPKTLEINRGLAIAARKTGVAMAVGSQRAALEDRSVEETYRVAREENPEGVLLANLSATCTVEEAVQSVEMIRADGIQVHFNIPQELVMDEGEPDFEMALPRLKKLVEKVGCPVIAKEVGFGMSRETILRLYNTGVRTVDIGGRGGTNFISIENARKNYKGKELESWGIPTAVCLLEGLDLGLDIDIIASGGMRTSLDIACSMAAGAKLVAMAGPFLEILSGGTVNALIEYIEKLKKGLSMYMVLTGAKTIEDLKYVPLVITGKTSEWLMRRGVNIDSYARRNGRN